MEQTQEQLAATAAIRIAFAAALAKVRKVPKDADNPYFKSRYQSLDSIQAMLKAVLEAEGLCYSQHVDYIPEGQCVAVQTILWDGAGNSLNLGTSRLPFPKMTPQDAGSAMSYCQRYALRALFAVETGEDTDAEQNMDRNAPARAVKPTPISKPSPAPKANPPIWEAEPAKPGTFEFKNRTFILSSMSIEQLGTAGYTGNFPENVRQMCREELSRRAADGDNEAMEVIESNEK